MRLSLRASELFIDIHIPSEDGIEGAHEALEAVTVDAHQGAVRLADDVGCAGLILQESELTKVLPWGVVVHDFFALLSLSSDALTFFDEVELVALLSGPDHVVTSLEALLNEGIRED